MVVQDTAEDGSYIITPNTGSFLPLKESGIHEKFTANNCNKVGSQPFHDIDPFAVMIFGRLLEMLAKF